RGRGEAGDRERADADGHRCGQLRVVHHVDDGDGGDHGGDRHADGGGREQSVRRHGECDADELHADGAHRRRRRELHGHGGVCHGGGRGGGDGGGEGACPHVGGGGGTT